MSKKVLLTDAVPDINEFWDEENNNGRRPEEFGASSMNDIIWTLCPVCHVSKSAKVRNSWHKDSSGIGHVNRCKKCRKLNEDGSNSLVANFPGAADDWDEERNGSMSNYTVASGKYVYVRCPECKEFQYRAVCDTIQQNKDGSYRLALCRTCSYLPEYIAKQNRKNTVTETLLDCSPEIKKYWDRDRNSRNPEDVPRSSREYVFIACPTCGSYISRRAMNSLILSDGKWRVSQCQNCAINEYYSEISSLLEKCSDVDNWWDYNKNRKSPSEFPARSSNRAYFVCPSCSYSFESVISEFVTRREDHLYYTGRCPSCNFSTTDIACPDCHGYYRPGYYSDDDSCPYCNNRRVLPGFNDLESQEPVLAKEWSGNNDIPANQVIASSADYGLWLCSDCGGEYSFIINKRKAGDDACPYCNERRALPGFNDLATTHPELAKEWSPSNDRDVTTVLKSTKVPFKWVCPDCKGEFTSTVAEREIGDDACPYCNDRRALPGFNDLATTHPELAKEWSPSNDRDVTTVLKSTKVPFKWVCPDCNGEYSFNVADREVGDNACPYCDNRRVLPGFNSFKVVHPDIMKEFLEAENLLIGVDADNNLPTSSKKAWWQCGICNYKYRIPFKVRNMKKKRGHIVCPRCKGRRQEKPYYI